MNRYNKQENIKYWNSYYTNKKMTTAPSPFAIFCAPYLFHRHTKLLELGCGNGRDAYYFSSNGVDVTALDMSDVAINELIKLNSNLLHFELADFTEYSAPETFDVIYSRFTIHSIDDEGEQKTFSNAYKNLKGGGIFMIEARSLKDKMFSLSTKISKTEGFTDHYRRFLDFSIIAKKLEAEGFSILYKIESTGLAKYKEEDPVIIRIIAQKL